MTFVYYGRVIVRILPENCVQHLRICRVGTRKIHLRRLLRARSFLVIHLEEKPATKVVIIGLIGWLRSRSSE